jgi:hypothetical protein
VNEKPTVGFLFFGAFSSDRTPKAMTVAIPVNYTSEFRQLFEATIYYTNSHSSTFIGHGRGKEVQSYQYKISFNMAMFVMLRIDPSVITLQSH